MHIHRTNTASRPTSNQERSDKGWRLVSLTSRDWLYEGSLTGMPSLSVPNFFLTLYLAFWTGVRFRIPLRAEKSNSSLRVVANALVGSGNWISGVCHQKEKDVH